ncbi:hypothetical protein EYS42_11455 [Aquabacterium lacunae]|uniref:Uncharacterized protein n=1 Tax=Aquabacterium lacunae TaxID=2528630 RepID=A0A4Q9H4A6_9BURK|nr:hypothetical protein [Aquabacterium lacunae]TBO30301.1 hypothetical protein EYS42_11455 [Aquabacterium lacunae]
MQRHLLAAAAALSLALITPVGAQAQTVTLQPGQDHLLQPSDPSLPPVAITVLPTQQRAQFSMLPGVSCQGLGAVAVSALVEQDPYCIQFGFNAFGQDFKGQVTANAGTSYKAHYLSEAAIAGGLTTTYRIDLSAPWSEVKIDLTEGSIIEGLFKSGFNWTFSRSAMGIGGKVSETEFRLVARDKTVYTNFNGASSATSTRPQMKYSQLNAPVWGFTDWIGPKIPLNQIAGKTREQQTEAFQKAGFTVRKTIDGALLVTGRYFTRGLALTGTGASLYWRSFGGVNAARSVLASSYEQNDSLASDPREQANKAEFSIQMSYLIRN